MTAFAESVYSMAHVLRKSGTKRNPGDTDIDQSRGDGFSVDSGAVSAAAGIGRHTAARLQLLARGDCRPRRARRHRYIWRQCAGRASSAVNIAAIAATLTLRFATNAIMDVKHFCRPQACSVRRVIPEIDIWRAATLMLKRYGGRALERSATRAEELAADGDHNGTDTWRRITSAVEQLANTTPPGPLH